MFTLEGALGVLRGLGPGAPIDDTDAASLLGPATVLAERGPRDLVDEVGRAILGNELGVLLWEPVVGARLIRVLLPAAVPSTALLEQAMIYLSLFFPELDDVIARCRSDVASAAAPADVAGVLVAAIGTLEGAE